jgi:UDP-N-acetylmuramate dehydrogenase
MNIIRNIDFSMYSSIKVGNKAEVLVVDSEDFDFTNYYIIGRANNLILSENHPPLAMLSKKFSYIFIKDEKLYIGGATPNGKIFSFCKKNNIKNFEFFRSLPGSLGGMIKMNAGMKDNEIFNNLLKIKVKNKYINKQDISYGYRYTDIKGIIFEAIFELEYGFCENKVDIFAKMRKNQPQNPSAGSCFKNPPNNYAGALIEQVGLKGYKIGDMCFSQKHANFLINLGGGTSQDAIKLIHLAQQKVKEQFNINLELEIMII